MFGWLTGKNKVQKVDVPKRKVDVVGDTEDEVVAIYTHPKYGEFKILEIDIYNQKVIVTGFSVLNNIFDLVPSRIRFYTVKTQKEIVDVIDVKLGDK